MPNPIDFKEFDGTVETPSDKQIAALEGELANERDSRLEERFGNHAVISFLVLLLSANNVPAVAFVPIILLYVGGLLLYAKRCGMDDVVVMLSAVWAHVTKGKSN